MPKRLFLLLLLLLFDVGANCFKFVYIVVGRYAPAHLALSLPLLLLLLLLLLANFVRQLTIYTIMPRTLFALFPYLRSLPGAPLNSLANCC